MSRTGPRVILKPRHLEGNADTQNAPDSTYQRTDAADLRENQRVSMPLEQSSPSAAQDDVDGDVSTSAQTLVCSYTRFRSRDFQERFCKTRPYRTAPIPSPLPRFSWADSADVWRNMLKKETIYLRDPGMFRNHPDLSPRMRAVLFDWLSEVCEFHSLHRETFTLAQDFVDRYLSVSQGVTKTQLQLVGTSALFLAAKLEEIYPPKLAEFAYETDNACTERDIIRQEMILVKALKWDLAPMTTNGWLGFFLQAANIEHITDHDEGFVFPRFSTHAFVQLSRLCEISLLDYGSLHFRYSTIAAAALYHHTDEHLVADVSGITWSDIYPCVKWMAPFAKAILEVGQSPVQFFPDVESEDSHNIQAHNVGMPLLERALVLQAAFREKDRLMPASLDLSAQLVGLLLPPDDDDDDNNEDNGDHDDDNNNEDNDDHDIDDDDGTSPDASMEDDDSSS